MSRAGGGSLLIVATFASVDDYIASFPPGGQEILQQVRRTMHAAVPGAGETISYNIPTLTVGGTSLVHFAGWKRHVSVYPVPEGDHDFEAAVAPYRSGASTAKFPLNGPIPFEIIGRLVALLFSQRAG
ncbi:MAG: DUF1801 domain-containing protein [Ilumatobacteraceae bacterium]